MRDYDKPLTIVLTGTGNSTKANTEALLDNFIFGNSDNVDAHMIVPFMAKPKIGLETAIKVMKESCGIDGKDYTPVVEPQGGSNLISTAQSSHQVPQGLAMSTALDLLDQAKDSGHDTAFICLYDPESVADFDAVDEAKKRGFTTLNLSEGLIDAFQDYESAEDKAKRKVLEEEYAAKQETEEIAPPKKATTPRKRAAKKAVAPVPKAEPVEPEKAPGGTQKLIAMAVEREAEKKAARDLASYQPDLEDQKIRDEVIAGIVSTELSGTIVMPSKLPVDLEPTKDIQDDIAEAKRLSAAELVKHCTMAELSPENLQFLRESGLYTAEQISEELEMCRKSAELRENSVTVTKSDIVSLGEAMEKMASGFAEAISVYKKIVENN